jgi:quercetin dioxygenase-like cupin family protein
MKRSISAGFIAVLGVSLSGPLAAQQVPVPAGIASGDQVAWGPAPPALPPGAKIAVLSGDPGKPGLFVLRLQLPPDYEIAAHSHPATEYVTVLAGSFALGHGDVLDRGKAAEMRAGGFVEMPAQHNHFAWSGKEGATIQVHMQGPFVLTYADPAKDPQRVAGTTAR